MSLVSINRLLLSFSISSLEHIVHTLRIRFFLVYFAKRLLTLSRFTRPIKPNDMLDLSVSRYIIFGKGTILLILQYAYMYACARVCVSVCACAYVCFGVCGIGIYPVG